MRAEFAQTMVTFHDRYPTFVFISGDLGFMALEKVIETYRQRFINAGVAEQNMISMAAGLAFEGFIPWVYSIAPFAVLRPYEQIRNDVCLHNLPVKIVGNGGGFGYGIMGATHHALEDIAAMRVLPHMKVYVPLVSSDVAEAVDTMAQDPSPNYLRLNLPAKVNASLPSFRQWRKVKEGRRCVLITTGPVAGNVLELSDPTLLTDLEIWSIGLFPVTDLPAELLASIRSKQNVATLEEHYGHCGMNEMIASLLLRTGVAVPRFTAIAATGYPSGRYGSQRWHQQENGLAGESLLNQLRVAVYA